MIQNKGTLQRAALSRNGKAGRVRRSFLTVAITVAAVFAIVVTVLASHIPPAQAATTNTLNFQARLQTASGAIVPDGYYNIQFNLYDVATGGTSLWTETYLVQNTQGLRVKNGYLTANLGSITNFPSINWDQDLYIGLTVRGTASCSFGACTPTDSEMTPRLKLSAVPYAFRAGQLATHNSSTGFTSTLAITAPTGGNQTFQIPDQGAGGTYTLLTANAANAAYVQFAPATAQIDASTNAAIFINKTGASGNILQLQRNGSDVLSVQSNGTLFLHNNHINAVDRITISDPGTNEGLGWASTTANWMIDITPLNRSNADGNLNLYGTANNVAIWRPTLQVYDATNYTTATAQSDGGTLTTTTGTGHLRLNPGGNVGIGSAGAPNYKLDVTGDINTSANLRTGGTIRLDNAGALSNITGYSQSSGNFAQTGSGTFATGTGAVSLNGDVTVASGKNLTLAGGYITNFYDTAFTNMIRNGSAENGTTYWYANNGGAANGAFSTYTSDSYFGPTSARFTRTNVGTWSIIQHNIGSYLAPPYFDTNKSYSLSFYVKSLVATPTLTVEIQDDSSANEVAACGSLALSASWQQFRCTFTPAQVGNNPVIYMTATNTTVDILFDGMMLTTGSQAFGYTGIQADREGNVSLDASLDVDNEVRSYIVDAANLYRINGVDGDTFTCSGGQFLQDAIIAGGIITDGACAAATAGVTTVGTFSGSSIANGASIAGSTITFGPADASNPGMVTTGTQTFAGNKTFNGTLTAAGNVALNGSAIGIGNATSDRVTLTAQIQGGSPLVFQGATDNGFTTTLSVTDPTANNTITLPNYSGTAVVSSNTGSSGDCLKSNGSSAPSYSACGSASTLQDGYNGSGTGNPQIQLNGTNGGLKIRDASSTVGNILQIQNSAGTATYFALTSSALTLQDSSGNTAFVFDSSNSHLRVYADGTSPTLYADIYHDGTDAVYAASSGTTRIGVGSGNIQMTLSGASDVLTGTKTVTLGSAYSANDFTFTRNITAGSNSLTGSVFKVESTSSGSSTVASNILFLSEGNNSATGNLILAQKNGTDRFKVDSNGTVTVASGQSVTSAGGLSVTGGASSALTLTGNAASTWSTTSGALTLTSAAATTWSTTTGNLTLQAGGANTVIAKPGSNSSASFQAQNASGVAMLTTDTSSGYVEVGSPSADSTYVLLTLDSYNQAADPSGTNGAMYYNTSKNVFRCYEDGAWRDCLAHHVIELGSDVSSTASTSFQNITGLSFSMSSGVSYRFHAKLIYTASANTIGMRASMTGPASPTLLAYSTMTGPGATTGGSCGSASCAWTNFRNAYDSGTTSGASIGTSAGNLMMMDGVIRPSANGTFQMRFAPETATSNGIVIKAGSMIEWW